MTEYILVIMLNHNSITTQEFKSAESCLHAKKKFDSFPHMGRGLNKSFCTIK